MTPCVRAIITAFSQLTDMRVFLICSLSLNDIRDDGAHALAQVLPQCGALTHLTFVPHHLLHLHHGGAVSVLLFDTIVLGQASRKQHIRGSQGGPETSCTPHAEENTIVKTNASVSVSLYIYILCVCVRARVCVYVVS